MNTTRLCVVCAGALLFLAAEVAVAQNVPLAPRAMEQVQALLAEKSQRGPAQRKMDSRLIFEMKRRRGDPAMARLPSLRSSLDVRGDGAALIDLEGQITPALEQRIREVGGTLEGSYPEWSSLRAWVPVTALETLAARSDVRWLKPASVPVMRVTSQGDSAHLANTARSVFGVDGSGVKICVISNGVDQLSGSQARGELPAVDVLPGRRGSGNEGAAMLEIIHDLAPGAALGFATGQGGMGAFANSVLALGSAGCQVIVDDVGYPDEPVFQDGFIAQAINAVTTPAGDTPPVIYVSAAGNDGGLNRGTSGTWEGDFRGVSAALPGNGPVVVMNDFGNGALRNTVLRDPSNAFVLTWSDPIGGSANDYDLLLFAGDDLVAVSDAFQTGTQPPIEIIDSLQVNDAGLQLAIVRASGANRFLRLGTLQGGRLSIATRGAIFGHPAAQGAIAVAAAQAGSDPNAPFPLTNGFVEPFSSDGPRRIFFAADGTPLTPGNFSSTGGVLLLTPDVVGADRVSTSTPNFLTFSGTSAAAPHVAAIAGLVLSATSRAPNPGRAPVRFVAATAMNLLLQGASTPRGGFPAAVFDEGAGVVNAMTAVDGAVAGLPCLDLIDNDGDGLTDVLDDPGCASVASTTEAPACNDGVDNDDDGLVDVADGGCLSPSDGDECGSGAAQSLAVIPLLAFLARRKKRTGQGVQGRGDQDSFAPSGTSNSAAGSSSTGNS